jgi:cytochrome c biogenesis protein CcmG/thiol:disulfide interchange protein DsbE
MERDQIAPVASEGRPEGLAPASTKKRSRKRSIIIFAVVSLLNVGLLALLWTQLLTPAPKPANGLSTTDPMVGKSAPNFTLSLLSAKSASSLSLASLKGKPIVLNMWSSTCGPCIAEAPLLQQQWTQAKTQGVVFLGVDYQDVRSDGLHFLSQYSVTYPNVLDATGSVAINYGVTGTPETFFINRQGIVVSHVIGELTTKVLQQNLQLIMH